MDKKLCTRCYAEFVEQARKRKHTVVPLHKSNYIKIEDLDDLKGINNKGGFYR